MFNSIYCMFLRVILRVRVILDSILDGLPGRRLGGTGGPVAPFRGARGDSPLDSMLFIPTVRLGPLAPLSGGLMGGPHKSILDLLVRTDTGGGSFGVLRGDPLNYIRCTECGRLLMFCKCRAGRDY